MGIRNLTTNILTILLVTFFLAIIINCSGKENKETALVSSVSEDLTNTPKEETDRDLTEAGIGSELMQSDDPRDGDDIGEPCKGHEYIVAAGTSVSLEFQVLMKREIMMIGDEKDKGFTQGDISIRDSSDYWTDMGVNRSVSALYLSTTETSVDMWGVRTEELIQQFEDEPGKLTSISSTMENNTKYKIKLTDKGFGIIEQLGNQYPGKVVAQMTENELYEALGGVLEIVHIDKRGTFTLPVEIVTINSENFILTVTYNISFPASLPSMTKGIKLWQEVLIRKSSDVRFVLSFSYDKKKGLFHVSGPWFETTCL